MILDIAEGIGVAWRNAGSMHRGAIASQTKQKGIHPPRPGSRGTEKKGKNKMEQYDYLNEVINDIKEYGIPELSEDQKEELAELGEREKAEYLYNAFLDLDSITGRASGSYFSNFWDAEECICHNGDLVRDMAECFGYSFDQLADLGPEIIDVNIRCYVLPEAIRRALEEEE